MIRLTVEETNLLSILVLCQDFGQIKLRFFVS